MAVPEMYADATPPNMKPLNADGASVPTRTELWLTTRPMTTAFGVDVPVCRKVTTPRTSLPFMLRLFTKSTTEEVNAAEAVAFSGMLA